MAIQLLLDVAKTFHSTDGMVMACFTISCLVYSLCSFCHNKE